MKSRVIAVDNKRIVVIDGALDQVEYKETVDRGLTGRYRRMEVASPATTMHRHCSMDFVVPPLSFPPFSATLDSMVAEWFPGRDLEIVRAYINMSTFGDVLLLHRDCTEDRTDVTALVFLCETWDPDWAGETVFLDANGELISVACKPNRIVLFDGSLLHAGRPPSRTHFGPRLSYAVKYVDAAFASRLK